MIKQQVYQWDMNSGWQWWANHLRRGRGRLPSYVWNRFKWHWLHRFDIVPEFPLNLDIEVSSVCNLKCDHCFRQYMDMKENDYMPMEMYKKIIEECGKYRLGTLKFSMRAEPTLHKDIVEMVKLAKEAGVREVWINTHGGQLTEEMAEGFIRNGLDCLTVSFDGLGKMYDSIRIPQKYDETLEKLKMFRRMRDRLKAKNPLLKVQTLWSAIKDDPDEYLRVMGPIVDKVSYNNDYDFKEIHVIPDPEYVCYRLWQRIAITSHGDFLKCPSDFEKDEVLDNVMNKSIKEVWDTLQEEERERHRQKKRLDHSVACRKCHHGAKVVPKDRAFAEDQHRSNDLEFEGGFEGVGLNRNENSNLVCSDKPVNGCGS